MTKELTVTDVREMAKAAAGSRLFSVKNEQEAFTLMLLAQAEGCHPMQAMQRYNIVQGRPAKTANAMLSDFQGAGGKVKWIERSTTAAEAEFMSPGLSDPVTVRVTMEDAKRAGLAGKQNWKNYPRQMLSARCISEGVGVAWAGARALYTPEEVSDFDDRGSRGGKEEYYTPPAEPEAAPPAEPTTIDHDPETGEVYDDEPDDMNTREPSGDDDVPVYRREKHGRKDIWVDGGFEPKITPGQLSRVHVLYKQTEVTEQWRRDRLQVLFNKASTSELSKREAHTLIDKMEAYVAKQEKQAERGRRDVQEVADFMNDREPGEEG